VTSRWVQLCMVCTCVLCTKTTWSQIAEDVYLLQLNDKTWGKYPFSIEHPESFLSERALTRRAKQDIPVDSLDLPLSSEIISTLNAMPMWEVVHGSKWMSTVTMKARNGSADTMDLISLPFVEGIKSLPAIPRFNIELGDQMELEPKRIQAPENYGEGWIALEQLNALRLHALGFQGQGMWIAVLDAGFQGVDDLPAFETLRHDERFVINQGANIAFGGEDVFAHSRHGASVLGTMGCSWTDSLIGTAPLATYFPYITEDVTQERRIEEEHWIVAAEHADSLGIDLINTSLGYSVFDDSTSNYSTSQLDGSTARISRASEIAASRGMIVVTSAGNNGDDPWRSITFPADAKDILSVGAVRENGTHAWFSGYGPSSDGRIKPEVMALGVATPYPRFDGTVGHGNGTSFASPILCGAAACLWQAHPNATALEIRQALIQSSHLHQAPNDSLGYGIPDLWKAHVLLGGNPLEWDNTAKSDGAIFPNPVGVNGTIRWSFFSSSPNSDDLLHWRIVSSEGALAAHGEVTHWNGEGSLELSRHQLSEGLYVFTLQQKDGSLLFRAPFVVQNTTP